MSKHTPGPWRVVYYDAGDCDYYDHNGPCPSIQAPEEQDCAIVHWDGFKQQYWSSANGNQKQIEANARLIAAAPDLLEALKAVVSDGKPADSDGRVLAPAEVWDLIRAALAKAEGGEG